MRTRLAATAIVRPTVSSRSAVIAYFRGRFSISLKWDGSLLARLSRFDNEPRGMRVQRDVETHAKVRSVERARAWRAHAGVRNVTGR
jgi:hypothetical protein